MQRTRGAISIFVAAMVIHESLLPPHRPNRPRPRPAPASNAQRHAACCAWQPVVGEQSTVDRRGSDHRSSKPMIAGTSSGNLAISFQGTSYEYLTRV